MSRVLVLSPCFDTTYVITICEAEVLRVKRMVERAREEGKLVQDIENLYNDWAENYDKVQSNKIFAENATIIKMAHKSQCTRRNLLHLIQVIYQISGLIRSQLHGPFHRSHNSIRALPGRGRQSCSENTGPGSWHGDRRRTGRSINP